MMVTDMNKRKRRRDSSVSTKHDTFQISTTIAAMLFPLVATGIFTPSPSWLISPSNRAFELCGTVRIMSRYSPVVFSIEGSKLQVAEDRIPRRNPSNVMEVSARNLGPTAQASKRKFRVGLITSWIGPGVTTKPYKTPPVPVSGKPFALFSLPFLPPVPKINPLVK
ncbi:hypothetical protein BKA82DRAFT_3587513 [Pisolithus tinctorius]|nr:hypothetical protein BKA82DRAFT_3587513 [Pisolithus tinctorius]